MKSIVCLLVIVVAVAVVSRVNSGKVHRLPPVQGKTTIGGEKTEIILESLNGHTIKLLADLDETVKEFKKQIEQILHVPVISQTLWLKGKGPSNVTYLENHHTLKSYSMHKDSLVVITAFFDMDHQQEPEEEADSWVVESSRDLEDNELGVTIKYVNGGLLGNIKVKSSDTVDTLKDRIATDFNLWAPSMWLIYETKPLHNERTLGSYNIKDGATIVYLDWNGEPHGDTKVTGNFWLENLRDGAFTKVHFQLSDTVASIKSWIESKFQAKTNCQYLIYNHQMLEDDKQTIDQLNVRNNSQMAWINIDSQCRQ